MQTYLVPARLFRSACLFGTSEQVPTLLQYIQPFGCILVILDWLYIAYSEIAQVMDFAAEDGGGIRWYSDFSWHTWIEERNPWSTVECFYGTINITEASIFGQHQT